MEIPFAPTDSPKAQYIKGFRRAMSVDGSPDCTDSRGSLPFWVTRCRIATRSDPAFYNGNLRKMPELSAQLLQAHEIVPRAMHTEAGKD